MGLGPAIDWAIENVNNAGGVQGRALEAQIIDAAQLSDFSDATFEQLAQDLLADPDVVGLTGILSSVATNALVRAETPVITSVSTTSELFRAYARGGYVWRTLESDTTQTFLLVSEAKRRGAFLVQLMSESSRAKAHKFYEDLGFVPSHTGFKLRIK